MVHYFLAGLAMYVLVQEYLLHERLERNKRHNKWYKGTTLDNMPKTTPNRLPVDNHLHNPTARDILYTDGR